MSKSSLSLTVVSGPKKGETLDRKPGSIIRIGRVVKGNTLAIKDPSISQKHVTIKFDPVSSRWLLSNLETSNVTFVNGALISSSSSDSPIPLSDGDVIKIGDSTSISVRVSPIEMGNGGRNMRNQKKGEIFEQDLDERAEVPENLGRNSSEDKENKDEVEYGRMKILENLGRGRRRKSAAVSKKNVILEAVLDENIEFLENTDRNCANLKGNRDESVVDKRMKVSDNLGRRRTLRSRVSKKEEILDPGLEDERIEILENSMDVKESKDEAVQDGSKVPENLGRGRRGKSATVSKKDGVVQIDIINAGKNLRRGRRTISNQILEKNLSMGLIAEDTEGNSSSVLLEKENLEPPVEGFIEAPLKKLGRGRRNSKKDAVLEDKYEVPKTTGRGRRTRSTKVSEEAGFLNSVAEDKISPPKNAGRGRRGRGKKIADSSKDLKIDKRLDDIVEDAVLEAKPRRAAARRTRASSNISNDEQLLEPPLDFKNLAFNPVENSYQLKEQDKNETVSTPTGKRFSDVPKVWNGNGIPNTTNKYKEDQKISWHDTPFEERVEKALSDDKLFLHRNLTD